MRKFFMGSDTHISMHDQNPEEVNIAAIKKQKRGKEEIFQDFLIDLFTNSNKNEYVLRANKVVKQEDSITDPRFMTDRKVFESMVQSSGKQLTAEQMRFASAGWSNSNEIIKNLALDDKVE